MAPVIFSTYQDQYPWSGAKADDGRVSNLAAKFGLRVSELKNYIDAHEVEWAGGSGTASVVENGDGTQTISFSSSSASVSDNGDGTQTITL